MWEWALGSCGVPVVIGVNVRPSGRVFCGWTYWHDEPDESFAFETGIEFIVSCRPGGGTFPTEGDVARWTRWTACPRRDAARQFGD